MNERQIACFLAVVNEGNFSQAAEKLFITQPAVTHQIRMLQDELNVRLFERNTVSTVLTDAGKDILQDAKQLMYLCDGMRKRALAFTPAGRAIMLGIPPFMLDSNQNALYEIIAGARQQDPPFEVDSKILKAPPEHVAQLADGEIDMMFSDIDLPQIDQASFEKYFLFESGAYVCVHAGNPLAKEKCVTPQMLADETIYGYDDQTAFLSTIRESLSGVHTHWIYKGSFSQAVAYLTPQRGIAFYTCKQTTGVPVVYVPFALPKPI